jgi:hypothetical protein
LSNNNASAVPMPPAPRIATRLIDQSTPLEYPRVPV